VVAGEEVGVDDDLVGRGGQPAAGELDLVGLVVRSPP